MKITENENMNKYLDFAWELKKQKMIRSVVGAIGSVLSKLEKKELEMRRRIETIQTSFQTQLGYLELSKDLKRLAVPQTSVKMTIAENS